MTYVPYHSGSAPETVGSPELLDAVRVFTPFGAAPAAGVGPETFTIDFRTELYRPNHLVTIRTLVDGWGRDLYGTYRDGQWQFALDRTTYGPTVEMKFMLDRQHWMDGVNLQLPTSQNHVFDEATVTFPAPQPHYRHGYDNLYTADSALAQRDLRQNTHTDVEYDVIVIGSGFGGGVLADALSDRGVDTLVLEAGSLLYPSHITNLPGDWPALPARHQVGHFLNMPGSKFLFGVQMNLGGRSVFWSGLIPRMHGWELTRWPSPVAAFLSGGGYDAAETLLRKQRIFGRFQAHAIDRLRGAFPDYVVRDLPRSRHQPDPGPEDPVANVLEKSTGTFSTADLLLDSMAYTGLAGRDNLTINLNHLVTGIETAGRKATAVQCLDLVGNVERRYRARRAVVLAAGSLESPRLALRSGLADASGKMGRGLTDHPAFFSREYALPAGGEFSGLEDHAKLFMHHNAASETSRPFNVELLINPAYWEVRHPDDDVRKQQISTVTQSGVRCQFVFASPLDDGNVIRDFGPWRKAEVFVSPNPAGLSHSNDVRDLRNAIVSFLGAAGIDPNEGMHYGNEGTVHHAGGSLRMSGNHTGVVDQDLRFEAYDNLYACDNSVFPMIPAANPALTLTALAQRLADHLAAV